MSARPKRPSTANRPGQILNDTKQKRRTKEQIEADNAAKAAEKAIAKQAAMDHHNAAVQRIATKETEIQQQEALARHHAARPDQVTAITHQSLIAKKKADELAKQLAVEHSMDVVISGDDEDIDTDGAVELPETSVIGTDSDRDLFERDDEMFSNDNDNDGDYVDSEMSYKEEDISGTHSNDDEDYEKEFQLYLKVKRAQKKKATTKKENEVSLLLRIRIQLITLSTGQEGGPTG